MSRGVSVTPSPAATRARIASTSRVTNAMSGSNPAATHALRTIPRSEGATHGSCASSRRRAARRRARRCSGPTAMTNGSSRSSWRRRPGVLAPRLGRVLEEHGDVQAAIGHARGELLDGALDRLHALGHHARDRRRDQRGQCAGEAADAQRAPVVAELGELGVGQREARRQRLRVVERHRPGVGQGEPAGAAVQQARSQLTLERGHLLGDRGLGQRELACGGRERAGLRDRVEGEQPARIQHKRNYAMADSMI